MWGLVAAIGLLAVAPCAQAVAALPQQAGEVPLVQPGPTLPAGVAFRLNGPDFSGSGRITSVAGAGDVNGDGRPDLVVGAGFANKAWVVFNPGPSGPDTLSIDSLGANGFEISGEVAGDLAGWSVDGGRDVNGDGLADVVLGAPDHGSVSDCGTQKVGAAYVVFGKSGTGAVSLAALGAGGFKVLGYTLGTSCSSINVSQLGRSVAIVPDMNGDGRAEIAGGAPYSNPNDHAGKVVVVFGRTATSTVSTQTLVTDTTGFTINGPVASQLMLGSTVAGSQDFNGDGLGDVVAGAEDPFSGGPGIAYVVMGHAAASDVNLASAPAVSNEYFQMNGAANGDRAGQSVGALGDIDGDGLADVGIGAPQTDHTGTDRGSVYVVRGRSSMTGIVLGNAADGYRIDGAAGGARLAESSATRGRTEKTIAGPGDVNGDGRRDALIGQPILNSGDGGAWAVYGPSPLVDVNLTGGTFTASQGFFINAAASFQDNGDAVAAPGDWNGDGRPDLALSALRGDIVRVIYGFGPASLTYSNGNALAAMAGTPTSFAPQVARTGTASFTVAPALPAGLAINAQTGVISGTPQAASPGTNYTVTMTDLTGEVMRTVFIEVSPELQEAQPKRPKKKCKKGRKLKKGKCVKKKKRKK